MYSQDTNDLANLGLCISMLPGQDGEAPFTEHPQLQHVTDILIRKFRHHPLINSGLSTDMHPSFLRALVGHLQKAEQPPHVRQAQVYYYNIEQLWHKPQAKQSLQTALRQAKNNTEAPLQILCFDTNKQLSELDDFIAPLVQCEHMRIILLCKQPLDEQLDTYFASISLKQASTNDCIHFLKKHCIELEGYHQVIISQEILEESLILARRYLGSTQTILDTLLLIDTAAARIGKCTMSHKVQNLKSALCSQDIYQVLSTWTSVPSEIIGSNPISNGALFTTMQQRLFNQSIACHTLQQNLQHAITGLQGTQPTLANFLLTGPRYTGKKTLANCLSRELFGQLHALYFVDLNSHHSKLLNIKVQRQSDMQYLSLAQAVNETPYAIFYFEGIEKSNAPLIGEIAELISTGEINMNNGQPLHFQQCILLFSARFGASKLNQLYAPLPDKPHTDQLDLMQLVTQTAHEEPSKSNEPLNPDHIIEHIKADIKNSPCAPLLKHLTLIPFLPINRAGISSIIQIKLEEITTQLLRRYGLNFTYASEVIDFLTEESIEIQQHHKENHIEHAMQQLYLSIEQSALLQQHHHSKQLYLQLNETGDTLRCHWLDQDTFATPLHQQL